MINYEIKVRFSMTGKSESEDPWITGFLQEYIIIEKDVYALILGPSGVTLLIHTFNFRVIDLDLERFQDD